MNIMDTYVKAGLYKPVGFVFCILVLNTYSTATLADLWKCVDTTQCVTSFVDSKPSKGANCKHITGDEFDPEPPPRTFTYQGLQYQVNWDTCDKKRDEKLARYLEDQKSVIKSEQSVTPPEVDERRSNHGSYQPEFSRSQRNDQSAEFIGKLIVALIASAIWGLIVGKLAKRKNRSALGWGMFGAICWILALLALAFMSYKCPKCQQLLTNEQGREKECPVCGKFSIN